MNFPYLQNVSYSLLPDMPEKRPNMKKTTVSVVFLLSYRKYLFMRKYLDESIYCKIKLCHLQKRKERKNYEQL